jgi:hypothetical protein
MPFSHAALISTLSFAPLMLHGQANSTPPQTPPPAPAATAVVPSKLLQPALAEVESTLNSVKTDKWKKGSVRDEAGANVDAMLHDLKTNLPPLMAAADAAPGSLSKSIPLMKHLDALYDVFLRVEEGARVSAPGDQVDQLEATLKTFGSARIDFYDSLQRNAADHEKQVSDLQASIKAQQQAAAQQPKPAPAPVPCTPPKPVVKKKRTTPAKPTQPAPAAAKTP